MGTFLRELGKASLLVAVGICWIIILFPDSLGIRKISTKNDPAEVVVTEKYTNLAVGVDVEVCEPLIKTSLKHIRQAEGSPRQKEIAEVATALLRKRGCLGGVGVLRTSAAHPYKYQSVPFSESVSMTLVQETVYIRVKDFLISTGGHEFQKALDVLGAFPERPPVVVDLRGNSGGYQPAARALLELFSPQDGALIGSERHIGKFGWGKGETFSFTRSRGHLADPHTLTILVDQETASASEIFAFTLRAWYPETVFLGQTTFKKGSVYTLVEKDGVGIWFPTREYFSPKGEKIDGVGISPRFPFPRLLCPGDVPECIVGYVEKIRLRMGAR